MARGGRGAHDRQLGDNRIPSDGLPVIGGSFNTVIGVIFLLIVVVSPDGLLGIWDRLWRLGEHEPGPDEPAAASSQAVDGQEGALRTL